MELTLQHLRLLREVERRSTITAAAEALGYTRSAVSQQLAGLERVTGVHVLERVGRNVRLTDPGRVLVGHAERILSEMEVAQAALEAASNRVEGVLDLGVYESVVVPFVAPLITSLRIEHPELQIRSQEVEPDEALDALAVGDLDLAFTLTYPHDPVEQLDHITRTPLADERFVGVFPSEAAPAALADLGDLATAPFICPPPTGGCGRAVLLACREAGFEPDIVHYIDSYPTAIDLVAAGCGIALIPEFSVPARSDVRTAGLRTPLSRTIEVSYRSSSAQRPTIRATLDTLCNVRCDSTHTVAS